MASMEQVRAAGAIIEARRGGDRMKNAAGMALFGDGLLDRLVTCAVCGVLGDEGDDCGRTPVGHRLTTGRP